MIKTLTVDDQSYESIVENARKAIRKYAPYWTDENAHDPGITLIEMLSWLKEMLQFFMDQSTEQLELQYLRLLGLEVDYGSPARTVVQCLSQSGAINLPPKTKLSKGRYVFENAGEVTVEPIIITDISVSGKDGPKSVYQNLYNGLSVYPFGEEPRVGEALMVDFSEGLDLNGAYKLYFKFYDDYDTKRNPISLSGQFYPLAEIDFYADCNDDVWVPLKILRDDTYGFIQSGIVALRLYEQSDQRYTRLKAVLKKADFDFPPRLLDLYNRVFEVVQLDTYSYETDPQLMFSSSGLPNQRFKFPYEDVFYGSLVVEVLVENDKGRAKWKRLNMVPHLHEAEAESFSYTIDLSDNCLVFGDGIHGFVPKKGKNSIRISRLQRSYLDQGNILLDTLVNEELSLSLKCLDHAKGGTKPSRLEDLKKELLKVKFQPEICVTASDYESFLMQTPGLRIKQVKCLPLFKPGLNRYPETLAENTVSVFVIPDGPKEKNLLSDGYINNLRQQVEKRRPLTTQVLILNPTYYEVDLFCEVYSHLSSVEAEALCKEVLTQNQMRHLGESLSKSSLYKALRETGQISQVSHMSLSCKQPVTKNHLGDILIPPDGVVVISHVEVQVREDK